jgi:hypothetical protein
MLAQDSGKQPLYYDICNSVSPNSPLTIPYVSDPYSPSGGLGLTAFLTKAAGSVKVDVIAYSSGGLFVRAYLSGILPPNRCGSLNTENPKPAIHPLIRKLILIGTPNFGIATPPPARRPEREEAIPLEGGALPDPHRKIDEARQHVFCVEAYRRTQSQC